MAHAKLISPSGAYRRFACPGSYAMELPYPDTHSEWADDGTASHLLASTALEDGKQCAEYIGAIITVGEDTRFDVMKRPGDRGQYAVDEVRAQFVQKYVDAVRAAVAALPGAALFVEVRAPIEHLTGEAGAAGTSDAVILGEKRLEVRDLKYGKSPKGKVYAAENHQLIMYALACLDALDIFDTVEEVLLAIHQPRLDWVDEWVIPRHQLEAWRRPIRIVADDCRAVFELQQSGKSISRYLKASDDACHFCKAKAVCPEFAMFDAGRKAAQAQVDAERQASITPTDEPLF